MKDSLRILWTACIAILASGCAASGPAGLQHLNASEKMVWSTYAVGTPRGMATSVLVSRRRTPGGGAAFPVLITSAHVLAVAPHGPFFLFVRLPRKDQDPEVMLLEFSPPRGAKVAYVRHPVYDVAALELPIPPEIAAELALPSFVAENNISARGDGPRIGDEVSVLGFPQVFPGTSGGFPVLRGGRVASYSAAGGKEWGKFLLNTNVYPGDSGAPVFAAHRGGRLRLVGLVTEHIGPRGGSVPLAVAVNARVIRETLELLQANEQTPAAVLNRR